MSMISAQCDELRDVADDLDRVTNGICSGVPASTWHGMTYVFDSASKSLRQAADTIWELRCKLADVVDQQGEIDRLKAENAQLRELTKDACTVLRNHYNKEWFDGTVFAERMCELGVEVDA